MGLTLTDLVTEFGTYIETNQKEIMTLLTQKTVSQNFMTTKITKDLEWRAAKAVIDDLVQGFQKKWTAKGTATFTPIAISQRRHKFDFEMYPDDVFESWLGFLADETKGDRQEWPITRYVIEKLILPKVLDNRELKLIGKGEYEAVVDDTAQATGKSMDGFCTILKDKFADTTNVNWFNDASAFPGAPTEDNILDWMEAFVDWIDELYQTINMPIFLSNAWYKKYQRKYRDTYGANQDYTQANASQVDFSNNRLQPLPSMYGENVIFTTPKENFIRLRNANDGADNIWTDKDKRLVLVSADWHESVGFAIEEAIFAYVPEESESGS